MEYVYGTAEIDGVMRENLKVIGGPKLEEGEYLTTVREYDDNTIDPVYPQQAAPPKQRTLERGEKSQKRSEEVWVLGFGGPVSAKAAIP